MTRRSYNVRRERRQCEPEDLEDIRLLQILRDEEGHDRLAHPIDDIEREHVRQLVTWFTRRYRTPAERLAYVRRAYRRWTR